LNHIDTLENTSLENKNKPTALILLVTTLIGFSILCINGLGQLIGFSIIAKSKLGLDFMAFIEKMDVSGIEAIVDGDAFGLGALVGGIFCILACLIVPKLFRVKLSTIFPFTLPNWRYWLLFLGLSVVVVFYMGQLQERTNFLDVPWMDDMLNSITNLPLFVLGVGIIVPIGEELLFRGILYRGFKDAVNEHFSVWVTSLLFVLVHFGQYSLAVVFILLMPLSLVLGYSRMYGKSMWIPIAIHIFNNSLTALYGQG